MYVTNDQLDFPMEEGHQKKLACSRLEYQNDASIEKWTLLREAGQYWYYGRTGFILLSCTSGQRVFNEQIKD